MKRIHTKIFMQKDSSWLLSTTRGFDRIQLFPLHYFSLEFGRRFPARYEVWERTNMSRLRSLLGESWQRYWVGVETAVYYVLWGALRYWFRLMWLTTVSSCVKWPHQKLARLSVLTEEEKTEACFWFTIWLFFLTNRNFGEQISAQNVFCTY